MLTSKQRSRLKSLANPIDTILQIGKAGIGENLVSQVDGALEARELIKLRVLDNCMLTAAEAARELAQGTNSEVVQVIGSRMVLYRKNEKNPRVLED